MVLYWLRTMASQVIELDGVAGFDSYIRGYHAYRDIWSPVVREILLLKREPDNFVDMSAIAVWKEDKIVGNMPYDIETSLQAALIHFNTLSIFLFMSILPNLVFIDPQMPLRIVNKCVAFSYKVQCGKGPPLTHVCSHPWKEGIITREMLEHDEFSSCFSGGVFDAGHALKLLESLHIIAPLSGGEFIMPCLLQAASCTQIEKLLPLHDEHVAVLLVHFPNGCIPNGTFCVTHNCLRSEYGWTTCRNLKREVECLYRNIVKLQYPDKSLMITLVHAPSLKHFEVHVETEEKNLLPELCPQIRDHVLDSIRNVERTFRYKESGATPSFVCPCDPNHRHTTTLTKKHDFKCTESFKVFGRRYVTKRHTVWLTAPSAAGTCMSDTLVPLFFVCTPYCDFMCAYATYSTTYMCIELYIRMFNT